MSKISDVSTIASLADADEIPIADASALTSDLNCTVLQLKTYANTAPVFAAGSATAGSWPKMTSGTVQTTPDVGSVELDANCFYGTSDAGNRGVIAVEHFIRADATRNLTSQTAAQPIFNVPAGGAITLETGTYEFEGVLSFSAMSATTGNGSVSFGGTGTFAAWCWVHEAADGATGAISAWQQGLSVTNASANPIATSGTSANLQIKFNGTFECTAAGTWIPQLAQTTAAAATVAIGSFVKLKRIGSTSMTSVGQWS